MSKEPKICVLIPAFNEEQVIEGTIVALRTAGFKRGDIYIVDDMSSDATATIARRKGVNVFTVIEKGGCKARAQLQGLDYYHLQDRYDWVVFLDADTKVEPTFLRVMRQASIKNPEVTLFVGQVKSAENNHVFSALRAYEYTYGQELVKRGQANFNVIFVSPGCASMYKLSDLIYKIKIEDDTLAEDMDLTIQVHRLRGKIKYIHAASVITQDPDSFIDYHKQIMRWYRGFWQIVLKHKIFSLSKKQPVDLYMMYLTFDTLILNRFFTTVIFCCFFPLKIVCLGLLIDVAVYFFVGIFCAIKARRWDILTKMPIFYWLSYLNLYAFLRSFFEIILCQKQILTWNKVKRYTFD